MFTAGLILLGYQYFSRRDRFELRREHLYLFGQIIFLGIFVSYVLRFNALNYVSAAKSMFIFNLSPFFSALFSYFFFKERMTKIQWLGLFIGFLGMIPILMLRTGAETALNEWYGISWAELGVMGSVALSAYSWIVVRILVRNKKYSPMMVNGVTMFGGGILALIFSFFTEGIIHGVVPVSSWPEFIGLVTFIIIISNIICHNMYGYLLREYTATLISFVGFLAPMFAAVYGWALYSMGYQYGGPITWHFCLSSAIVFVGLFLFYKDELFLKKQHAAQEVETIDEFE